jgi:hypothetical protein
MSLRKRKFSTGLIIRSIAVAAILTLFTASSCTSQPGKYPNGSDPKISVAATNSPTVKKYEKFEVTADLKNVKFNNPYDPADIDIWAIFTAPSGAQYRINGFFDDYKNVHQWKIRFSPRETGEYKYIVFVKDGPAQAESEKAAFTASESDHHGWIKPSTVNPHYFSYDDGTTYYGVGVYSPWGNSAERFKTLKESKSNFMALWDINYGGFVNDCGVIEEKPGQYNQEKLGKIDSLLAILENDNIELMFAIWPHDLFSETVWAAQWKLNAYSQITKAENIYSDTLAWKYQQLKYRYLIARFAHSRSWGIWELINEMDGTDGWAKGHHDEAFAWVDKCVKFFEANDPYKHPVTASFSGGFEQYREEMYKMTQIPNIHVYPAQGWKPAFPSDSARSDMYNFGWAAKRFWDNFEKPAIFGEAGADLTYFKPGTREYHTSYHNQIWASLTNGLACTPVWWAFDILQDEDWVQLKHLSEFVSDIDFANLPFKPAVAKADDADVYILDSGDKAFGWIRSIAKSTTDNIKVSLPKASAGSFSVLWFNTWNGEIVGTEKVTVKNGTLQLTVPASKDGHKDIALKITRI